ncbi:MAG: DUF559 domain-containing protein, partial [Clostridia bacterium]|nr:DUF559 domain-containing protein [Clostridia bacterium]
MVFSADLWYNGNDKTIDGSQHYTEEGRQKDEFRTEILEGYDLKVIRFTNRQINTNFRGVCEYIDTAVKA